MTLIPHSGRGILVALAVLVSILLGIGGISAFSGSVHFDGRLWPLGVSVLLGALVSWLLSKLLLVSSYPVKISEETGKKIIFEPVVDHVFHFPVKYWAPILAVIGALLCIYDRYGRPPAVVAEIIYEQKLDSYPLPILVPVEIENTKFTFVLDISAESNCFDPGMVGILKPLKEVQQSGESDGDHPPQLFVGPDIAMKGWVQPSSRVVIHSFGDLRALTGLYVSGAIGVGAMKGRVLSLDFDRRVLQVFSQGLKSTEGMDGLDLGSTRGGLPAIEATIGGQRAAFIIDTGDSGYVGLRHEIFVKMVEDGTIIQDQTPALPTAIAIGAQSQLSGHFTKGALLGFDLNHVPVLDTRTEDRVGMGFLSGFNLVLDLSRSKLFYERRKAEPPIDLNKMLGASVIYMDGHNPSFLGQSEGGAMAVAGLNETDHLVKLGPLGASDIDAVSLYELCLQQAGKTVDMEVLRTGEVKSVTLHLNLPQKIFVYPPESGGAPKTP